MKIAKRTPFSGRPILTMPTVLGASPNKPFFYRIPVIGERPITLSVEGLPEGLSFDGTVIRGQVRFSGCTNVTVTAQNALGKAVRTVRFEIFPGNIQRTPLMGFTTWNAFDYRVTESDVLRTAEELDRLGLADYGYQYVNLDSSWQGEYGGSCDAIQPCERFPDMAGMIGKIHARGLRFGIYSSPFLKPWGCPKDRESLPGCTVGDPDPAFPSQNGGIGLIRKEENNVRQWSEWGIDYLKYDWMPTDPINGQIMREALNRSSRDIAFCVTVAVSPNDGDFWRMTANSFRGHTDSTGNWKNVKEIANSYLPWQKYAGHGHYYDLDMLAIGKMNLFECTLTEDEMIFDYTLRAMLGSPIQLSCDLTAATDFELDLYMNDEVIAINQDGALEPAILKESDGDWRIYEKALEDGGRALCVFNGTDEERAVSLPIGGKAVRDVWLKEDLGVLETADRVLAPHSVWFLRV